MSESYDIELAAKTANDLTEILTRVRDKYPADDIQWASYDLYKGLAEIVAKRMMCEAAENA